MPCSRSNSPSSSTRARATGRIVFRHRGAEPPLPTLEPTIWSSSAPAQPLCHPHARAGDRPAGLRQGHLHRRRRRLSASRRGSAPPRRPQRPRRAGRPAARARCRAGRRRSPRSGCSKPGPRASAPSFALPPSRLALEPGDVVALTADGRSRLLRITEIGEHGARDIEARGIDPDVYAGAPGGRPRAAAARRCHRRASRSSCSSICRCCAATSRPHAGYVAAAQSALARRHRRLSLAGNSGFPLKALAPAPAVDRRHARRLPGGATSPLRPRHALSRAARSGRARLRHRAAPCSPAPMRRPSATTTATWEVLQFQSAVAHRARDLRAFRLPARPGRHRARHARAARRRAPASSCSTARWRAST